MRWLVHLGFAAVFLSRPFPPAVSQTPPAQLSPKIEPSHAQPPVEVRPDRTVTFRVWAPRAASVGVEPLFPPLQPDPLLMKRDEQGIWSLTVGPLPPDIWGYTFYVDGLQLPFAEFEVPGDGPQFYSVRAVPHGTVSIVHYHSAALQIERRAFVYTPPDYERGDGRYSTLYLLHPAGSTGSPYWTQYGRANLILDNLIADRAATPMVVVMPFGYPVEEAGVGQRGIYQQDDARLEADLTKDLIPLIERRYRVSVKPEDRAIAGASMGASQAISIGLRRHDLFRWVGSFSGLGGLGRGNSLETILGPTVGDGGTIRRELRLLWFAAGDLEARVLQRNEEFSQLLSKRQIAHQLVRGREWNHQVQWWRRNLRDFSQLLFKRSGAASMNR